MFKVWCCDGMRLHQNLSATFLKLLTQHFQYPLAKPRAYKASALEAHCISALSIIVRGRSPSEIIASGDQWIMRRQPGLLVLLTLSHPWESIQNELICWLSPAGLVILQSHVSHSVPAMPGFSPAELHRPEADRGAERETDRGRESKTLVCRVFTWNPARCVCTDACRSYDTQPYYAC